jgi:hypothetical protein
MMTNRSSDRRPIPKRSKPPQFELLFETTMPPPVLTDIGVSSGKLRQVAKLSEVRIDGPRLHGQLLPSSVLTQVLHPSGVIESESHVSYVLDDGHRIYAEVRGIASVAPEVALELADGRPFGPDILYIRGWCRFEAADDGPYSWLNRALCISKTTRTLDMMHTCVWQLL